MPLLPVLGSAPTAIPSGPVGALLAGESAGTAMMVGPALLERILSVAALAVGVGAAAILLLGVARSVISFAGGELRSGHVGGAVLDDVRGSLGRYLLLGLELLVAADVLDSILAPSIDHVVVLAGVVVIRTVIGFSLNWELERHHGTRHAEAATAAPVSAVGTVEGGRS